MTPESELEKRKEINKTSFIIETKCLDIDKLVGEIRQEAEKIREILMNEGKE